VTPSEHASPLCRAVKAGLWEAKLDAAFAATCTASTAGLARIARLIADLLDYASAEHTNVAAGTSCASWIRCRPHGR
jgi:hypothetical protein